MLTRALGGEASVSEITHDPSARRIRIALSPERGADGAMHGVYVLSTDVTEEAQARAALAQTAKRELAAQLTSGLAHDFSNLLTIILGLQGRLQRLDGLPDGAAEMSAATLAAARRGGTLLDRIAVMSGPREPRPTATDLGRLFADIAAMAGPTLPEGLALRVTPPAIDTPLLLDAGALQDALLNLILNARDAVGPRAGTITLKAQTLRDTWLEITVADTGPGFSDEALLRGLDPFFTTKGGEGSGLGLTMVYDSAKMAGGSVRLANGADGAEVTLRLPLRRADQRADPIMVLLVEDNDDIRAEVRAMLRMMGHSVIEAASAEEALDLAGLPGIGLVLSDIVLKGAMTGVDLAERLAAQGRTVRLMTSLPPGDGLRTRAGRFPVLSKPFGPDDLTAFLSMPEAA